MPALTLNIHRRAPGYSAEETGHVEEHWGARCVSEEADLECSAQ